MEIIECFTFSCKRKSTFFFKEGGQSNTKVRKRDKNKISISVADFPLVFLFFKSGLEGCFLSDDCKQVFSFCYKTVIAIQIFSWVEENNSNNSTGPLMAKLTPQRWLTCLSCVLKILQTPIFSLTCFNLER